MDKFVLRRAKAGEEAVLHEAHMRSIREVCVKDHGEDEVRGWGNRPLGNRWTEAIQKDIVWVIEVDSNIYGVSFLKILPDSNGECAYLHALYLTPEVIGRGLGLRLMQTLLDEAKEKGVRKIKLDSSITAYQFYRKLGFSETGPKQMVEIGGYPVTSFPMELNIG